MRLNVYKIYDEAIFKLLNQFPYLGYFAQSCKLHFVGDKHPVQTGGVLLNSDASISLFINKTFFKKLSPDERVGLIMHEILHLIYYHLIYVNEIPKENMMIGNIAADIDVNQNIPKKWHIDGMITIESCDKEGIELEREKTFHYYYKKLLEVKDKLKQETLDNHEIWGDGGANPEQAKVIMSEKVREIAKECEKKGVGKHALFIEKIIDEVLKDGVLNWKILLKRFIGKGITLDRVATRTRPNRRLGIKSMGIKSEGGPRTIFAVDVSGSMSDDDYLEAMSEVKKALREYPEKAEVVFFESEIVEVKKLASFSKVPPRMAAGGTNFNCVLEYANKKQTDLLIVLTDGWDSVSIQPKGYEILWLLLKGDIHESLPGKKIIIK